MGEAPCLGGPAPSFALHFTSPPFTFFLFKRLDFKFGWGYEEDLSVNGSSGIDIEKFLKRLMPEFFRPERREK
jgi:hypothetical protein